jgi:hypothetical protein
VSRAAPANCSPAAPEGSSRALPVSISTKVMARFAALAVLIALVVAVPAFAWSSPSPAQRRAIVAAIRKKPAASGVKRVERVRISTVDRQFASAVTVPRDKAGNVLARDSWLVRHYPSGWRVVFVGSDMPPCKVASAAVRRDLLGSAVCFTRP